MKPLFILLAQSVTGAVIFIVALLLVAAIIGYITSWFYAKSVYTPIIKGLEAEKAQLNDLVSSLRGEISNLNAKVEKLNEKIGQLDKEIIKKNEEIAAKDKEIETLLKPKK